MPSKVVLIVWDTPTDEFWLAEDNIATALHAYCPNTRFRVYPGTGVQAPFETSSAVDLVFQLLSRQNTRVLCDGGGLA